MREMADADWNDDDVVIGDQTIASEDQTIEIASESDTNDHEDLFDEASAEDDVSDHCSSESDLLTSFDANDDAEIEIQSSADVQDALNAADPSLEDLAILDTAIERFSESCPSDHDDTSQPNRSSAMHSESAGSITESQDTVSLSSDASEQKDAKETQIGERPNENSPVPAPGLNIASIFQNATPLAPTDQQRTDPMVQVRVLIHVNRCRLDTPIGAQRNPTKRKANRKRILSKKSSIESTSLFWSRKEKRKQHWHVCENDLGLLLHVQRVWHHPMLLPSENATNSITPSRRLLVFSLLTIHSTSHASVHQARCQCALNTNQGTVRHMCRISIHPVQQCRTSLLRTHLIWRCSLLHCVEIERAYHMRLL